MTAFDVKRPSWSEIHLRGVCAVVGSIFGFQFQTITPIYKMVVESRGLKMSHSHFFIALLINKLAGLTMHGVFFSAFRNIWQAKAFVLSLACLCCLGFGACYLEDTNTSVAFGVAFLQLPTSRVILSSLYTCPSEEDLNKRSFFGEASLSASALWLMFMSSMFLTDLVQHSLLMQFITVMMPTFVNVIVWLSLPSSSFYTSNDMKKAEKKRWDVATPLAVSSPKSVSDALVDFNFTQMQTSSSLNEKEGHGSFEGLATETTETTETTEMVDSEEVPETPWIVTSREVWANGRFRVLIACDMVDYLVSCFWNYNAFPLLLVESGLSMANVGAIYFVEGTVVMVLLNFISPITRSFPFPCLVLVDSFMLVVPVLGVLVAKLHWSCLVFVVFLGDVASRLNSIACPITVMRCLPFYALSALFAQLPVVGGCLQSLCYLNLVLNDAVESWLLTAAISSGLLTSIFVIVLFSNWSHVVDCAEVCRREPTDL